MQWSVVVAMQNMLHSAQNAWCDGVNSGMDYTGVVAALQGGDTVKYLRILG